MGFANTFVGLVGEYLVFQELGRLGWSAEWLGGRTKDRDLVASSPAGTVVLDVSVKTSTAANGKIHRAKPGREIVDPWIRRARQFGRVPVVVLLQADPRSVTVEPDSERGGFFVPTPAIVALSAFHAAEWGDRVDAERAEYGQRRRRRGPGSEYLKPEKLFYPLYVDDGEPLAELLDRLA